MQEQEWIILDTETTGFARPIYTLEIAAQRMRGLKPVGEIFQIYLNHDIDVPYGAQQVHGYSREFLSRNGVPPLAAYRAFSQFANNAPICAYNLPYDYDAVLLPEWQRLSLPVLSPKGFCMMKLSQQVLSSDVVQKGPGQFKLQSLKDRFKLPDRVAHSASGDVLTIIDLLEQVLNPTLLQLGLSGYVSIKSFLDTVSYPDVLDFGKFKGRQWREAETDSDLYGWLKWLSLQSGSNGSSMAKWCLTNLSAPFQPEQPKPKEDRLHRQSKAIRACPKCRTRVYFEAGRQGSVTCPNCRTGFSTGTPSTELTKTESRLLEEMQESNSLEGYRSRQSPAIKTCPNCRTRVYFEAERQGSVTCPNCRTGFPRGSNPSQA